ncbi:MAG: DUF721 domain-containing protein [Nitrospirota bacterium]
MPRQLIPVGEILRSVLKARGLGSGDLLAKIRQNWASAVGKKISQHACPHLLRDGRLTLDVDSPAWMSELSMLSPEIIEKINSALDGGQSSGGADPSTSACRPEAGLPAVRELKFRLGAGGTASDKAGHSAPGAPPIKKRELSSEEKTAADTAASKIQDKELRRSARKMLSNACRRVR